MTTASRTNTALAAVLALGLCSPGPARAQAPDRVGELERRLDVLSAELERLKLGETITEPPLESVNGFGPAAAKVYKKPPQRVSIGGYGEMLYSRSARRRQDAGTAAARDRADMVRAILYAGYKFSDRILFNSELEFEHGSTGKTRGEVSVEQAYLDFRFWEALGLRAGVLLVPMGITNEMHEPTVYHGARRPSVETNIIPSTWRENGVGVFGRAGMFSYRSYLLAGLQAVTDTGVGGFRASDGLRAGRSSGANSFAEDKAWVTRLEAAPLPGITAGGSLYIGEADHNFTASAIPVTLWELHAVGAYKGAELKALYAEGTVGNADSLNAAQTATAAKATASGLTAGSGNAVGRRLFGGYLEGAYDVLTLCKGTKQALSPFFRYERYSTQAQVPDSALAIGSSAANSRVEYTLGLTYKPIPQVAAKLDHQWLLNQARTGVNQWNFGLGYIF